MATGESYNSLMYGFRVSHNTIFLTVREVCQAIVDEFADEMITTPTTQEEWLDVAQKCSSLWNFHHSLGVLDGKHIAIKCPKDSGSLYHNYTGFFSIVMLALVDADYKFLWVDVEVNGSASDAQVFNSLELKDAIDSSDINFPETEPLPHDDQDMPYFIVRDDVFALQTWMMKTFSKRKLSQEERIFNYRLSRARRIVENAFGILVNRFQCLLTTMRQEPLTVQIIILACCSVHSLMRLRYSTAQNFLMDLEKADHSIIPCEYT
ncbi:uncharacterized protein LOC121381503 [Gigantopelta aegis]|uniref:uncharacterized protein LOC121381503 n=1 Tax=Gigantopelta aegis TaxID=1735272 RepID=UPI001B88B24D|nr:uncharacterized protein LOC121381503 [Gigantopelta aegis]